MESIKDKFGVFQSFPKEGVAFLDISPILLDKDLRESIKLNIKFELDSCFKSLESDSVDKVIAIESRGFLFGEMIASHLDAGLILARKPGKLPGEIISESYGTEYSKDTLSIQLSSIKKGDKVLIHDDVLATGGTALAVNNLVKKLGGIVVGYLFLAEITPLKAKNLLGSTKVISIVEF